jgi:hypothetical protein
MQLRIHLNTAQILAVVIAYYYTYAHESNGTSERSKVIQLKAIPPTLFPLLTTLTVTALSGESFIRFFEFLDLILMVGSSFAYLVDQS